MTATAIHGEVAAGFEPVRDRFASHFDLPEAYREIGAALAVYRHGECVVDLWGGHADRARTRPWQRDTLVNLWSTTKGVTAMAVALLVDRGSEDESRADEGVLLHGDSCSLFSQRKVAYSNDVGSQKLRPTWNMTLLISAPSALDFA
jgi:hypothetical protein